MLALDRRLSPAVQSEAGGLPPESRRPRIWLSAADPLTAVALQGGVRTLASRFPDHEFLVTPTPACAGPGRDPKEIAAFLDAARPVAVVLTCSPLRPTLTVELQRRGIPVVGSMLRLPSGHWLERRVARPLARRLLSGFRGLLAEDPGSLERLRQLGAPPALLSLGGILSDPVPVPPGNAAEQYSLTELMRGRPMWCAAALPLAEASIVAEAHRHAQRRSHRLLLVVVPERPEEARAIHDRLAEAGLVAGLRSEGEDPVDEISAYVADLEGELGLWLRLAPVSYIGGTMTAGVTARSPLEAAALGSAVLHGPEMDSHAAIYARLAAAGAARLIRDAEELVAEIDRLSSPDMAALMAHAGWEVASAGDEAAEHLATVLAPLLRAGSAVASGKPAGKKAAKPGGAVPSGEARSGGKP